MLALTAMMLTLPPAKDPWTSRLVTYSPSDKRDSTCLFYSPGTPPTRPGGEVIEIHHEDVIPLTFFAWGLTSLVLCILILSNIQTGCRPALRALGHNDSRDTGGVWR